MSRNRLRLATACVAVGLMAASAHAQVKASDVTTQVDPWGVGWLAKTENPLAANLWANADGEQLKPLFESLKPELLSPAGRQALRRVILSGGKTPENAGDLVLQRLRLLEELGELDRSIDLRRRFASTNWGADADIISTGRDLVASNTGPACRVVAGKPSSDPNWMELRAFCLAMASDFDSAGAVAESWSQTQQRSEGSSDGWLVSAIEAMREPTKARPPGRFATPLDAAISVNAKLPVPATGLNSTPPDIALFIVRHHAATGEQKRAALRVAIETGKLTAPDVADALATPLEPAPKAGARTPARPKADYLALALAAAADAKLDAGGKATAYAVAFKSSETVTDFRLAALALLPELAKLPKSEATGPQAETFARAALMASDEKEAGLWRALMDKAAKDKQDDWAEARIDLMLSYAGASKEKPAVVLDRLIGALPPEATTASAANAQTPAQRQIAIRRIEVTRALFLQVGAGRDLTAAQRTVLAGQKTAGRGVPDAALARIQAALEAKANGEAALAAIAQLGSDPSALSFSGLADLMIALSRAGMPGDPNAIALEALQVWKAI